MNWETQRHDGAALRGSAGNYYSDDGGLTDERDRIGPCGQSAA